MVLYGFDRSEAFLASLTAPFDRLEINLGDQSWHQARRRDRASPIRFPASMRRPRSGHTEALDMDLAFRGWFASTVAPTDRGDTTETEYLSLQDAEAALRLINAARAVRGEGELELKALDLARARTIRALDSLLSDAALWGRLAQQQGEIGERGDAETALTDAVTDVLVRVGHVPPPGVAEILMTARQSLDAISSTADIKPADIVAAAKVALDHLRRVLAGLAETSVESVGPGRRAVVDRRREALDTAGEALVHVVTAGGVSARKVPRWALGLLSVVTTLSWAITGNLATDVVKGEPQVAQPQPAATAPAVPGGATATSPFGKLRLLHSDHRQLDPSQLRDLRQDLLDDIAGSDRWSAAYRLARLDQLVMDGAVPESDAKPVREELERQKAKGL